MAYSHDEIEFFKFILASPIPSCYAQNVLDEIKVLDGILEEAVRKYSITEDQSASLSKPIEKEEIVHDEIEEVKQDKLNNGMSLGVELGSTLHDEFSALAKCIGLHEYVEP